MEVAPIPYPTFTGCNIIGGNPIIFFSFVMLIMFETSEISRFSGSRVFLTMELYTQVIVFMTAFRGYRQFKGSKSPLVATLVRDGILFYIFLFRESSDTNLTAFSPQTLAVISLANVFVLSLGPVGVLCACRYTHGS